MASSSGHESTFSLESVVRGHHIYKAIWTPQLAEHLGVSREDENAHDTYAVRVFKNCRACTKRVQQNVSFLLVPLWQNKL